jgi:hypothetical protein
MSEEWRYFVFDSRALGVCGRKPGGLDKAIVLTIEDSLAKAKKEAREFGGGAIYKATENSDWLWVADIYE